VKIFETLSKRVAKMSKSKKVSLAIFTLVVSIVIIWAAYLRFAKGYAWADWTGFEAYRIPKDDHFDYIPAKTLWDFLGLLIVPLVLAVGAYWFNAQQQKRGQAIETDRQCEIVLQAYLDKMAELLLDKELRNKKDSIDDPLVEVARTRTVTTLRILDKERRNILLQFLRDAKLDGFILKKASLRSIDLRYSDLSEANLSGADLIEAHLIGADLTRADLSGAHLIGADLSKAYLTQANLTNADLSKDDLIGAHLLMANLTNADLSKADLSGADLSWAYLIRADLNKANLSRADLSGVILGAANLNEAILNGATVSNEQLTDAESLKGATMPDGEVYDSTTHIFYENGEQ